MPGRLGIATVLANAVFAFVTGVSIAAAAAFSRIAWPEMKRHGYERKFALGCIAGSACLGMLIPPSVLMIVWGVLTEQAIGKLFIAGIIPGFVVVAVYSAYILFVAVTQPERVGEARKVARSAGAAAPAAAAVAQVEPLDDAKFREVLLSTLFVILLIVGVLGGIWLGFFTPTEGAGVGAALSLLLAIVKGMRAQGNLRGHPDGGAHLRAAAAAAGDGAALQPRAVHDRRHRRGQGAVPRLRPGARG